MKITELHAETWAALGARRSRLPHALLLTGQRGSGKFDLALAFARSLLCEAIDLLYFRMSLLFYIIVISQYFEVNLSPMQPDGMFSHHCINRINKIPSRIGKFIFLFSIIQE